MYFKLFGRIKEPSGFVLQTVVIEKRLGESIEAEQQSRTQSTFEHRRHCSRIKPAKTR